MQSPSWSSTSWSDTLSIEAERPREVNPWVRGDEVIDPCMGTTFNSSGEAYDFYNLYSWEHGFGIRYGKTRLNAEKTKCMKGIVCGCSGKPTGENTKSCKCECPAMVRLLRTLDNGQYITEHRVKHHHTMRENCGEKVLWPSHKHIRYVHQGPGLAAAGQQHKHWENLQHNCGILWERKKCAIHEAISSEPLWSA